MNGVQSLADFIHDVSRELIAHADNLGKQDLESSPGGEMESIITEKEAAKLREQARSRKNRRLLFFNDENGSRLRLVVRGHEQRQQKSERYCALCGNNQNAEWRGHRSLFMCSDCDVHLCIRTYSGCRKSFWDVWHSAKSLKPRQMARPERSPSVSSSASSIPNAQFSNRHLNVIPVTGRERQMSRDPEGRSEDVAGSRRRRESVTPTTRARK